MKLVPGWILATLLFTALVSCSTEPAYTSLDIDLMPCERGLDNPKFFHAVEFNKDGTYKYPEQLEKIKNRLRSTEFTVENGIVTDLVIFNHGWNKSPQSAEVDYRQFICRLHTELVDTIGDAKRRNGLLIVGVFWPSTITNKAREPYLLKPLSYIKIRKRADILAEVSLSKLYSEIGRSVRERENIENIDQRFSLPRVSLIGHSFGARMTIRAMETLNSTDSIDGNALIKFLTSAKLLNVLLLNAAMPNERFDWIGRAVQDARDRQTTSGLIPLARFTESTQSYLFNVHSKRDTPNRVLFPLASILNSDSVECAVGACGIRSYPTVCVSSSGIVRPATIRYQADMDQARGILIWNVDAQNVLFSHSDIYKGRVAIIVDSLLYNDSLRSRLLNISDVGGVAVVEGSIDDNHCVDA